METLVVGFDGSETSVVALDWVAERAAHRPMHTVVLPEDLWAAEMSRRFMD